ncbi:Growth-arrest-specific protein, putative [Perkinsus marinus ATCC 50983]|uniref:Growth-arrest-specific protein, putative n=1 Tax=Perkinsus marinus (strain ATCC 50983 / TXsc) TaxID=423536 RepID=C5LUR3_PERM5|nr:Growth-arrest-specific protein, putative [Perkinsus marinus ATCC 50983]EEQ99521.1 Growth-arrest-specific protein, putative [Perkinsus marinus ATCC 50983]|eukprot:XP_002766804.1 Growth-arrest-specific protein, putative [Perkinsus marinus ATCC 50983]
MGKKGGKKGGKKAPAVVNPDDIIPQDLLDLTEPQLQEKIESWEYRRNKAATERNYMEMERDLVNRFYTITKREIEQLEAAILCKERQTEVVEKEHRVKMKVHEHKVHSLVYHQTRENEDITKEAEALIMEEDDRHIKLLTQWHEENEALKESLQSKKLAREEEVKLMERGFAKSLEKLKETYECNQAQLEEECRDEVENLGRDLEVRRRVEIHEMRERKNLHMNELTENHNEAFEQIKGYYQDITQDNVKLIQSMKDEIALMRDREKANKERMTQLIAENKTLSEPLAEKEEERAKLMELLKNYSTDKIALENLRGRRAMLEKRLKGVRSEYRQSEEKLKKKEEELEEVMRRFAKSVDEISRMAELKNVALEKRLDVLDSTLADKRGELKEKTLPEFVAASEKWNGVTRVNTVKFGEVDCTNNKELREALDVHSYPTIRMWPSRSSEDSGELLYTYRGIRTQEAFLNYLEFMSRDNVRLAHSLEEIQALSEEDVYSRVILITRDLQADRKTFDLVAATLKGQHSFFILASESTTDISARIGARHSCDLTMGACLAVVPPVESTVFGGEHKQTYAEVIRASEVMFAAATLQHWIEAHAFPGVWKLDESNSAGFLRGPQEAVVIAVDLSSEDQQHNAWLELQQAYVNDSLAEHFRFGIIDGVYWATTLISWGIHEYDLPRAIVLKGNDSDLYWEDADELAVGDLSRGLEAIISGRLQPRNRRDNVVLNRLANSLYHPVRHFISQSSLHLIGSLLTLLILLLVVSRCIYETCGLIFIADDVDVETEEQLERIRAITAAAERRKKKEQ